MQRFTRRTLVACTALALAVPAWASGFSIYEQSAKASGQAGAWVARADDAAANWYNPAAIVRGEGMQFQFGTNLITVGSDTTLTLSSSLGGGEYDAEGSIVTPSHVYFTHKINDRIGWGIGLNTPIGLTTEWDVLPITLAARRSELATFVINPNLAFALGERWAVAVGVDYMFADVGEFSRDIDQSPLLGQAPLTVVGRSDLTGDGDDTSWNVALHYAGDQVRFGLTYRDGFDVEIDGDVAFTGINPALTALFPDGPGSTTLGLPAQGALGVAWTAGDAWEFEFDVAWAEWSSFAELALDFGNETFAPTEFPPGSGNPALVPVVEDAVLVENWEDTLSYRLGVAWAVREKHEIRFGALFDEAPIPIETSRPSIPDGDRTSVTFGYGYRGAKWNVDVYYMPLFFDDVRIPADPTDVRGTTVYTTTGTLVGEFPNGTPDQVDDGVLPGRYESFVHLAGVTFNVRF